ncbi:apolipoprotein D-like [Homarus americanus]|uniref:Apolipoprotein D-like 3 n=1 Tax=Homarus americanus TaxID=6706 RepID=A0A8J5K3V0_HOMAM|nr:apolipoprotein D-like [Homarus americanus]KAG7166994.1 Apolipoprotein D-like 3 [Homarus americanus]
MVRTMEGVVVVLAGLVALVTAHKFEMGTCKPKPGVENFDPQQFSGTWYVIETFMSTSSCITDTYTQTGEGFQVKRTKELYPGRIFSIDHIFTVTGDIRFKDPNGDLSAMTLEWPWSMRNHDVTVLDTDYSQYAIVYDCQSMFIVRRVSYSIIGRERTLDNSTIESAKSKLVELGVKLNNLSTVNHENCNKEGEADFDLNFDEVINTFSGGSDGEAEEEVETVDVGENEV